MTKSPPMTEHGADPLMAIIASIALCAPVPIVAKDRFVTVANCLGGMNRIDLPSDPTQPSGHECCAKGCHAANDRRKKGQQSEDSCC
jgi:hypothetical protein